jgi:hypothetical protein
MLCCTCATLRCAARCGAWIGLDREEETLVRLRRACSSERFCCALCDLQWYVDLISPARYFASRRSDLGLFLFVLVGIFFVFYAAKPFSGIRARSMRRCFTRVKCYNVVVGVNVFGASFFSCTS